MFDIFIAGKCCTTSQPCGLRLSQLQHKLELELLPCTVQSLKNAPVTSITDWQFPEPDWVPVTFSGAPSSM